VLWNTYGDCENYGIIEGHKGAVLDLQWSRDSRLIYSASADTMLATWDVETGERVRKLIGHEDIVNSVAAFRRGGETLASGSDDCTIGVRGPSRISVMVVMGSADQVCCCSLSGQLSYLCSRLFRSRRPNLFWRTRRGDQSMGRTKTGRRIYLTRPPGYNHFTSGVPGRHHPIIQLNG
jgi:WD40 repeat protein